MSQQRLAAWRDRRRDPLTFTLRVWDPDAGREVRREFVVPDRPARTWVLAYLSEDPVDLLLDVLEEEDADELWEEARDPDSEVTPALLHTIGRAVLTRVAGRPWWQAGKLIATLVNDWPTFDAIAADRGLGDVLDWGIERLCSWVYLKITAHKDEAEVAKVDGELSVPPPGVDLADLEDTEDPLDAGADWFAAMAALGGGVADENGVARG